MDIRIGVTYTPKEVTLELGDDVDRAEVKAAIDAAIGGESKVLWLVDKKGREVAIPADKISYVELGSDEADRPIGFG
ncbi:MAG: DUF3107 domain-containing protein [Acidimicrobiales bacterium]